MPDSPQTGGRPLGSRLLGGGARGARRLAGAAGIEPAAEALVEEAIVAAIGSAAVERALIRVAEEGRLQEAVERAMASAEVEEAIRRAIDSEVADRVWEDVLASDKAQMLVERIAEAPEVRAAIAAQGFGLLTDLGRRISKLTEAVDDVAERVAHGIAGRDGYDAETNQAGLITRTVAFAIDTALLGALLSIGSGLLASIAPVAFGEIDGLSALAIVTISLVGFLLAGTLFVAFWSLVGQTPGMRFLGIRLDVDGSREIGFGRAVKRLFAIPLAVLPAGLGILWILLSPRRRGLHDRLAGTEVVYDHAAATAPWSTRRGADGPERLHR